MATHYKSSTFYLPYAMQETKHTVAAFIGNETTDKVSQPMRSEENYIYENHKRVEKISAVSSFLLGSPAKSYEANQYDKMNDFLSAPATGNPSHKIHGLSVSQGQNFINTYCYNNTQTNTLYSMNEAQGVVSANKNLGQSTQSSIDGITHVNVSHTQNFTNNQLQNLQKTGGFSVESHVTGNKLYIDPATGQKIIGEQETKHIIGSTYIASGNLASQSVRVLDEQSRNAHLNNNLLRNSKTDSIAIMRTNAVHNMVSAHRELQGFTGSAKDFANIKKYGALYQGGPQLSHKALQDIDAFKKVLGDNTFQQGGKVAGRYSGKTKQGAILTRDFLIGNDMSHGYRVTQTMTKATMIATRLAYRAGLSGTSAMTGLINKTVNKIGFGNTGVGQMLDKMDKGTKNFQNRSKAKRNAYKQGRQKEWKHEQRIERKAKRTRKPVDKLDKLQNKATLARTDGNLNKADKYQNKAQKQDAKIKQRANKRQSRAQRLKQIKDSRIGKAFGKISNGFNKAKNILGKPFKVIKFVTNPLIALKMWLQRQLEKIIAKLLLPIIMYLVLALAIFAVLSTFIVLVVKFYSDENEGSLKEVLANTNFCQIIVDDVSLELEPSYLEAIGKDAQRYYSDFLHNFKDKYTGEELETEIAYSGVDGEGHYGTNVLKEERMYDWFSEAGFGEIGHIYESCTGTEITSMANMLPIMSMLHYRYEDALDFTHFYQMKAYSYYMWVHSREEVGYSKSINNFCVATGDGLSEVGCTNMYKHGYDWAKIENNWATSLLSRLESSIEDLIGRKTSMVAEMLDEMIRKTNDKMMVYWDTKPRDTVYLPGNTHSGTLCEECSETISDILRYDFEKQGKYLSSPPTDYEELHYAELSDVEDLYEECKEAEGIEHTHGSGCNDDDCDHECDENCLYECTHTHDENCCDLMEHIHTGDCYVHTYQCLGHCAGHFTPYVDINVDMCWESLAVSDQFKTPYFMTATDFCDDLGITHPGEWVKKLLSEMSIKNWRKYWTSKMNRWFIPLPDSTLEFFEFTFESMAARVADWYVKQGDQLEDSESDYYDFEGYNVLSGGTAIPNPETMEELCDFYDKYIHGNYENSWTEGRELWEDFDVVFPMGGTYALSASKIKEMLEAAYASGQYSEQELILLETVLNSIGKYTYSLSYQDPSGSASGRMDCSGWVATVLMRSGIWSMDDSRGAWTSMSFASNGTKNDGVYKFGEILAKNATSSAVGGQWIGGGTNHTLIILGADFDASNIRGAENSSGDIWIADCSSSQGGATIRKVSKSYLDSYGYQYNP